MLVAEFEHHAPKLLRKLQVGKGGFIWMKLRWRYESLMLDRDKLMLVVVKSDFVLGCFCLFWIYSINVIYVYSF